MNVAAFLSYVIITSITPGPSNLLMMNEARHFGFVGAWKFNGGILIGFAFLGLLSAGFTAGLDQLLPMLEPYLQLAGVAYLLYLAWKIGFPKPTSGKTIDVQATFLSGFVFQMINVKSILFFLTVLSTFILPHSGSAVQTMVYLGYTILHRELLGCCEQRDGSRAAELLRRHLDRTELAVREAFRPPTSPRAPARPLRAAIVSAYEAPPEVGRAPRAASRPKGRRSSSCSRPRSIPPTSRSRRAASRPAARRSRTSPGSKAWARVVQSARFEPGTRVWASGRGLGVARDGAFARAIRRRRRGARRGSGGGTGSRRRRARSGRARGLDVALVARPGSPRARSCSCSARRGASGRSPSRWRSSSERAGSSPSGATRAGSRRVGALGADATVALGGDDFRERLAAAVDGAPPTLVLDLLWGPAARGRCGRRRRRERGSSTSGSRRRRPPRSSRARAREAAADPRLLELRRSARRARAGVRRTSSGTRSRGRLRLDAEACRSIASGRPGHGRRAAATSSSSSSRDARLRFHRRRRSRWPFSR